MNIHSRSLTNKLHNIEWSDMQKDEQMAPEKVGWTFGLVKTTSDLAPSYSMMVCAIQLSTTYNLEFKKIKLNLFLLAPNDEQCPYFTSHTSFKILKSDMVITCLR
jgi:hypothetical protein